MVGKTISHYQILEKLGEGGMGVVYKAEDIRLHRIVALKFLHPEAVEDKEFKARFLHEAEAAAAINHPNICTVYDIDEAEGHSFIAMERIEGESLAEKLKKRPLRLDEAVRLTMQVAEGLRAAHNKGIVHRDIKSANVIIDTEGRARIMDFGLAHLAGHTKITKTGVTMGTPAYMSPEQVRGQTVDHRTDAWSLGVVLYEMITGQLPFRGEVAQAVMYSILNQEQEPPTALRSGLPIDLDRVVGKALAKSPEQRYQHIDDLLVDLRSVRQQLEAGERPQPHPAPPRVELSIGQMLGHYRLEEKLGEGGMGVVYRALDTRLDRPVAIKLLHSQTIPSEESKRRFVQEAKAASALNHPNIVTIHDISATGGMDFIVMEYIGGKTLDRLAGGKGLPLSEALNYAVQTADALVKAHAAGVVHRDIKPGNIMVTPDGLVKILDFGLAKLTETAREAAVARLHSRESPKTGEGQVLGTVAYMSPEQAEGKPVDARSDIFSFGTVLYEMLVSHRPFQGNSELSTLISILRDSPAPIEDARPDVPRELRRIVCRCLEKDIEARYPSAEALARDLQTCLARVAPDRGVAVQRPKLRRRWFAGAAVTMILAAGAWFGVRAWRIQWAENEAIPQASRLAEKGNYGAAFEVAQRAERIVPASKALASLWPDISQTVTIETTPAGADVELKDYAAVDAPWGRVGRTPLKGLRIARGYFRLRLSKEGFAPVEGAAPVGNAPMRFLLEKDGAAAGMVRVPASQFTANLSAFGPIGPFPLGEFRIDRFEVTNRQFKEFVDRGGYRTREYWKQPFVKNGRSLSFEQATAEFVDATGRPGPSTWEAGTYPSGRDEFPVSGVSWYEAAAYAEFAGKSLPTIYHWYQAAQVTTLPYVVAFSNLGGAGPDRVGRRKGVGRYGTYDMLGNVREWCWNEEAGGRRYILGGAWSEPDYMFYWAESPEPFDRAAANGFRCVKYIHEPPASLLEPRERRFRDYSKEKPISDEAFRVIRSMYAYQHIPLDAAVISEDSSSEHWRKQKVVYNAGYGDERITAYLFLPKRAAPPYQTLVFFPGATAAAQKSSETLVGLDRFDFLIKTGRALLYPVYKGTYERQAGLGPSEQNREVVGQWIKELGHSVDYLKNRSDIDPQRLAYVGYSMGARLGCILLAFEDRFRTALLVAGGFHFERKSLEIDELNFAPRVKTPLLMLNGKYDFIFPVDTSQKPMFRLLGTAEADKRHITLGWAHDPFVAREQTIRASLDWLDRYLGPVKME